MVEDMFDRDKSKQIGKQITLPLRKAIEISAKSLKIRFWRSIITIASIVLAITFLTLMLVNSTITLALKTGSQQLVEEQKKTMEQVKLNSGEDSEEYTDARLALTEARRLRDNIRNTLNAQAEENGEEADMEAGGTIFSEFDVKQYWLISLALLVCFVGIVNAMLMSVTERFREIGTMKCLGALDSFIVKLFMLESMFQGAVGTFIGILVGVAAAVISTWWLYGSVVFAFFPVLGVLLCMVIAQVVGTLLTVLAAVFPARAAARMQPVEALRVDQ